MHCESGKTCHAKAAWLWLAVLAALLCQAQPATVAAQGGASNPGTPWPATDALGRAVATPDEVGPLKSGRFVGIFYFLTLGNSYPGVNDNTKIMAQDPDARLKPDSPLWHQPGVFFWGEPLYGYYNIKDPWVLRHHAQLLADAGVDTLIFDTTNAVTYPDVYGKLCEVFTQVRKEGGRTPQICFMVNTRAGWTAEQIYNDLYKPGRFKDLWFVWKGKPLMICDPADASPELKSFFTLRKAHWPFELVNTHNEWHWESTYPQVYSYDEDPAKAEMVNVAVAQNLRDVDGQVTNMSDGNARGRSFHNGKKDLSPGAINQGFNAQEQWKRALQLDPPFVMVTGWNEWTAGPFFNPGKPVTFVDQFNEEYSRDIEPMKGGHGDNYYYQMVSNIRRYKGAPAMPEASAPKSIKIDGDFTQWQGVTPEFEDHVADTEHRDHLGSGPTRYTNASGRNDLRTMKVARDDQNVYFYARTRDAISPSTDPNWMLLMIDADKNPKTGWHGYEFIVNRTMEDGGKTSWLEKSEGGKWTKVAKVNFRVQDNELQLAIPRAALGLPEGANGFALDFKWWDNPQNIENLMDTYLSGDTAPEGRFNYRYATGK